MAARNFSQETTGMKRRAAHEFSIATCILVIAASFIWRIETTGFVVAVALALQYRWDLSVATLWVASTTGTGLLRDWQGAVPAGTVWLGLLLVSLSGVLTRLRLGRQEVYVLVYLGIALLCASQQIGSRIIYPLGLWIAGLAWVAPRLYRQWLALRQPTCSYVPS